MRNVLYILSFLLCSIFASAKVSVDSNGYRVYDLSGNWSFQLDRNDVGEKEGWYKPDFRYNDEILLPGSMPERLKGDDVTVNTQWVGGLYDSSYYRNPYMEKYRIEGNVKVPFFLTPVKHYVGKAWYKYTLQCDKGWSSGDAVLFLERPHIATKVWVNGNLIGEKNSLSEPHVYNIPMNDKADSYTIVICVDNRLEAANVGKDSHSVSDQTQGDWNGIVGKIELREYNPIKSLQVYPDIDNKKTRVNVQFNKKTTGSLVLIAESFNTDTRHVVITEKPVQVKEADVQEVTLDMGDGMLLWDENNPQMYRLTAELYQGEKMRKLATYFGMRKIEIRGKMFYVNGKEIQLRGTVENCDFPNTGYPPTDLDSWLKVFNTCKSWGLNHVRFHTYCPPEAAFLAADMTGMYIQPEGPSWPNHGVKLGRGEFVDTYLYDEAVRICDTYGNHPSFTFFAFGNEPAGNWVRWSTDKTAMIKQYDTRHLYCGFSVGGGWAWQPGSEFAVKAGARGLDEWVRTKPESMKDFSEKINMYNGKDMPGTPITMPFVSHETGQWCAFPNFNEIPKYTGVNRAKNFEIFCDILNDNGMGSMAGKFLLASGKLQALCYKYEIERTLRTPNYAGFQLLSLNDYSGQGTALVGLTDVFFDEKGYISAPEFKEFCSQVVPLAKFPKFTYSNDESFEADITLNNFSGGSLEGMVYWNIQSSDKSVDKGGKWESASYPIGQGNSVGHVSFPLNDIPKATKLTLTVYSEAMGAKNHWDFWVYPPKDVTVQNDKKFLITDTLDSNALKVLKKGGKVLLCAAGKVSYGREVKQYFTPVFWNTSWFKMRPPHTTGIYINNEHPIFSDFPTDDHSDLQWWELVNKAQVMQFTDFPSDFQPLVQSIDTWFVSRKIGMLFECNIGKGRLVMTTMDIQNNLDNRIVARQMRESIINYMQSEKFHPQWNLDIQLVKDLFVKVAGEVNMYTNDSPDELKPKLK